MRSLPAGVGDPIPTDELRTIQLHLLGEFRRRCDELGLRWFVTGGTLLGAVRHQGYIPWDDDLDVMMPRADFEAFCAAGDFGGLRIASQHRDRTFPFPFAKLGLPGTRVVEHYDPMPSYGAHIDVFPVDRWPAVAGRLFWVVLMALRVVLGVRLVRPATVESAGKRLLFRLGRALLAPVDPAVVGRLITRLVGRARQGSRCGILVWGRAETFGCAALDDAVPLVFEGTTVPAPRGWHDCLTAFYGEYLVLPPVEQRVGHALSTCYRVRS
jgi:lipopolysaccharide cholinephosphotransferase